MEFQNQTFKVARYCVRKKVEAQDVGEVHKNAASGKSGQMDGAPLEDLGAKRKYGGLPLGEEGDVTVTGTEAPQRPSSPPPRTLPIPGPRALSVQLFSSPSLSIQIPPPASSFDRDRTP